MNWELLLHQVLAGLATGGIYACIALAVVMIYQAIDHLNFAQGEMAMFSTFIAWQLIEWGCPYWVAFAVTIAPGHSRSTAVMAVMILTVLAGWIAWWMLSPIRIRPPETS